MSLRNLIEGSGQSISEVNRLLYAGSVVVAERLGLMKERKRKRQDKNDPWWKRRIEGEYCPVEEGSQ